MESNLVETLITTNAIGAMKGEEFYWKKEWPARNMEI